MNAHRGIRLNTFGATLVTPVGITARRLKFSQRETITAIGAEYRTTTLLLVLALQSVHFAVIYYVSAFGDFLLYTFRREEVRMFNLF